MQKHIYLKNLLIVFLVFFSAQLSAQKLYYPDSVWQTKKPSELKMNASLIDSAVSLALRSEVKIDRDLRIANLKAYADEPNYRMIGPMKERGGPAGVIVKNGYIVAQWGDVKRVDMTFSATKSYLSTMAGLALDEGLIKNVHDKVKEYVWDGTYDGEHNSKISWEHLLNQSSDWSGSLFGQYDWADRPSKSSSLDDWKYRKLNEPGNFFKYNDVRVNLLAYSLLQVWRKPLPMILKEKIMDPIGASTTWRWYGYENSYVNIDGLMMQSVSGGGHFGGGLFINTLDHARYGLLFLRKGKWNNQQLISENWVNTVQQPSFANKSYGYLWWLNRGESKWAGVPESVYSAQGFGGNYVIVDSEHDLVVVARWMDGKAIGEVMALIVQACENKK
jgi:CubicO group peptidase (beta-lactamase class C family)